MNHVDVYRLDHLQEAVDLGLAEMVDDDAVTLIEWGDVVAPVLASDFLEVRLEYESGGNERRRLGLAPVGRRWVGREPSLAAAVAPWSGGSRC